MAKKKKTEEKKELMLKKQDLLENIEKQIADCLIRLKIIAADYLIEDEALNEMIGEIDSTAVEISVMVQDQLPDNDFKRAIDLLKSIDADNIGSEELLKFCDMDGIITACVNANYAVIKMKSFDQRDKLIGFINEDIYPHYLDQQKNVFI